MANDQMPNYGIQTQRKIITTDRTALFISKPVKCQQQRVNKEETIKRYGKRRKEIREEKKRDKGRKE